MPDNIKQLQTDLMYLAQRQKVIEDAVIQIEDALLIWGKETSEWSEFLTKEVLKQGIGFFQNKRELNNFKKSLTYKFKEDYEKFESLFLKIKQLFGERRRRDDI